MHTNCICNSQFGWSHYFYQIWRSKQLFDVDRMLLERGNHWGNWDRRKWSKEGLGTMGRNQHRRQKAAQASWEKGGCEDSLKLSTSLHLPENVMGLECHGPLVGGDGILFSLIIIAAGRKQSGKSQSWTTDSRYRNTADQMTHLFWLMIDGLSCNHVGWSVEKRVLRLTACRQIEQLGQYASACGCVAFYLKMTAVSPCIGSSDFALGNHQQKQYLKSMPFHIGLSFTLNVLHYSSHSFVFKILVP